MLQNLISISKEWFKKYWVVPVVVVVVFLVTITKRLHPIGKFLSSFYKIKNQEKEQIKTVEQAYKENIKAIETTKTEDLNKVEEEKILELQKLETEAHQEELRLGNDSEAINAKLNSLI